MDEHADNVYEPFRRIVPVSELPFPFHLFRCPFVDRNVRAVHAARTNAEEDSTPDPCARAFRLFVGDVGTKIADCPYHLPDWHLAAQRALEPPAPTHSARRSTPESSIRRQPVNAFFRALRLALIPVVSRRAATARALPRGSSHGGSRSSAAGRRPRARRPRPTGR